MGTHPIFESDFDCLTESKMSNPPTNDFSKKLNINAASFVPGQNFNAPVFVPGGGFGGAPPAAAAAAPQEVAPPAEPVKVEESEEDWDDEPEEPKPKEEEKPEPEEPKEEPKPEPKEPEPVPEPAPKTESEEPEAVEEDVEEVQLDFVNIVFIGHVDAGKSTMSGQILKLTGMVDQRTLEKYERESKDKNRESWALSWCIDTNDEERDKGKTVEYGKAFFETEKENLKLVLKRGARPENMQCLSKHKELNVLLLPL